jgi:hypothetical protein
MEHGKMGIEYRDLNFEQRRSMFDKIQTLLKDAVPTDQIKEIIMADYGLTDMWTCRNRWEAKSLDEFIVKVKKWSEMEISIEDLM